MAQPQIREVYLNAYATVAEAKTSIGAWLSFYNEERQHQSLGYHTPRQIYQDGLWICGRSASPTGCASPASRASSGSGEMLALAHIPTGAAADTGFDIDEVKSRSVEPAIAVAAIRGRPRTRPGYTLSGASLFPCYQAIDIAA